jgi:LysM repeat protein
MFKRSGSCRNGQRHSRMRSIASTVLLTLLVAAVAVPSGLAQGGTVIRLTASPGQIDVGGTTTVTLQLENVSALYGAEVTITFDPSLLEVQDANPGEAGVQVTLGTFLSPDFVVRNVANNASGTVDIALTQLAPRQPVSGSGVLATIVFKGKQSGTSALQFQKVVLSDTDGVSIPVTPSGASVAVGAGGPTDTPTPTATSGPTQPTPTPTPTTTPGPTQPSPTPRPSSTVTPSPGGFYYTVRPGDNLFRIALRFGTTIQAIVQANGIINPRLIRVGQVLWIPSPSGGTPTVHIVQRGDTLYSIARRFGTTYQVLAAVNGLSNPRLIYVGQRLIIPGPGAPGPTPPPQTVYVVQRGDTLWSIALRFGTTPWAIAVANGLWNPNLIYLGQRLIIP